VNRLSGNIPSTLLDANAIKILDGNIFDCGITKRELPTNDPDRSKYSCGSDAINAAVGSSILLVVVVALCLFVWIVRLTRRNQTEIGKAKKKQVKKSVGKAPEDDTYCSKICAVPCNYVTGFYHSVADYLRNQYNQLRYCFEDTAYKPFTSSSFDGAYYPLVVLDKLLSSIRSVFFRIALIVCFLLLPIYTVLSHLQSIYYHSYAWQVSAILLSGYTSGIILIIVFFGMIVSTVYFFVTKIVTLYLALHGNDLKKKSVRIVVNGENNLFRRDSRDSRETDGFVRSSGVIQGQSESMTPTAPSDVSSLTVSNPSSSRPTNTNTASNSSFSSSNSRWTMSIEQRKKFVDSLVAIGFGLLNFSVMILIDIIYVEAVLTRDGRTVFVVQVLLSIFKLLWNEGAVWKLYPLIRHALSQIAGKVRTPKVLHQNQKELWKRADVSYLVFTMILNNVVIPCISIAIISSNCFYNALFAEPPHEETTVYTCNYYATLGIFKKCLSYTSATEETSFNTPFYYRYQCGSAFVMNFVAVHIFMFIFVGLLVPLMKLLMWALYQWCGNEYSRSKDGNQSDGVNANRNSFKRVLRYGLAAILPVTLQDPLPLRSETEVIPSGIEEETITNNPTTLFAEDVRYLYKEKLVVRLSAYLSIVLTFGVLFPPLAAIGSAAVLTTTYFEQFCISSFLSAMQADSEKYSSFRSLIERDCYGIVRLWYGILWLLAPFASLLYAWIIFDTIGDKYGWLQGSIPAICMFALPFLCFFTVHFLQKYKYIAMEDLLYQQALGEEVEQYRRTIAVQRTPSGGAIGAGGQTTWRVFSSSTISSAISSLMGRTNSVATAGNVPNPMHDDNRLRGSANMDQYADDGAFDYKLYRDRITSIEMTSNRSPSKANSSNKSISSLQK
jgi:hypothetical protein